MMNALSLDAETHARLTGKIAHALLRSAFSAPSRRAWAVVVLRSGERPNVTSRPDFASWLSSHDMPKLAAECLHRRVPPGSVLVWVECDDESVATAGFVVFDLRAR